MNSARTYATAGAFRRALEERVRHVAKVEQVDVNRLRRQVSFDRLLARLFQSETAPWALKGGYALELRIKTARATVDMDLALQSDVLPPTNEAEANQIVHEMLEKAASLALGDWFVYRIGLP